ncbi:MAG: peptidylprolyl isomerase [Planctomycetales bacterium]
MSDARPSMSAPGPESRRQPGTFDRKQWLFAVGGAVVAVPVVVLLMQGFRATGADAGTGAAGNPAQGANEAYVARVGNYLVKRSELADACLELHAKEVLENVINRVVIHQACQKHGLEVTEAEVNQEIVRIAAKFSLPVDTWLKMLESEREITAAQYRRDIIWPMLALKKLAAAEDRSQFTVTEQEMGQAFVRDYGPRAKAKMIMFDNLRRAEEAWNLAQKNPADFGRLAREYSVDPSSRTLDGQIPPIRKYLMVPYEGSDQGSDVLWKKAFELKPGEVSSIIQIGRERYVVLLGEGLTEPLVQDIADVRDVLREQIVEEKIQRAVASKFEKLKRETPVDNYITAPQPVVRQVVRRR